MLLTNHTLTGIVLALTIDDPLWLAPAAVGSHLILDMTPHFGTREKLDLEDRKFIIIATVDVLISLTIMALAIGLWPRRAVQILVGVAGAGLPDFTYIPVALFSRRRIYRWFPWYSAMLKFLAKIQWYEKPAGAVTEVLWAGLMLRALMYLR